MNVRGKTQAIGQLGEDRAVQYLVRLGWQVLERNWSCRDGELDIVAYDPQTQTLVFLEVKCRSGVGYGDPLEAITWRKRQKLRQLGYLWLTEHRLYAPQVRIDAIGVLLKPGEQPVVTHVRGIAT